MACVKYTEWRAFLMLMLFLLTHSLCLATSDGVGKTRELRTQAAAASSTERADEKHVLAGGWPKMPQETNLNRRKGPRGRHALENGLGSTPPLGWSSWNAEGENVTEEDIKHAADALVSSGLKDAGYVYVNLDDGWAGYERDENGDLTVDKESFPSGIRSLADYVHSKGLKFGIYSSAGPQACSGRLGSLLHEDQDARWFAKQGVDFLKYDSCDDGKSGLSVEERFVRMRDALAKVDRRIYYAMGYWGKDIACAAGPVGNSWRTFFDIYSSVERVFRTADQNNEYANCQGPHFGWNDADALQIGRLKTSQGKPDYEAERTQMSLWSIMKSPLIIGYAVQNMGPQRLAILSNREVIAINQDPLGKQATKRYNESAREVWAGPLSADRVVVALVNLDPDVVQQILVDWRTVGLEPDVSMRARDVWKHVDLPGDHQGNLGPFPVAPHGTVLLILSPVQSPGSLFLNWGRFDGGFRTPWIVVLGIGLVALAGVFAFLGLRRVKGWTNQNPPRGNVRSNQGLQRGSSAGYRRGASEPSDEGIPLQDRPEKSSSIRTQGSLRTGSGLKREASTRINRSRTGGFDAV